MSSLSNYLASKYLSADPVSKPKKKKRKTATNGNSADGLIIAEDDIDFVPLPQSKKDDEDGPAVVGGRSAEFRGRKTGWKVVGGLAPSESDLRRRDNGGGNDAMAESIVRQAQSEREEAMGEDAPVIMGDSSDTRAKSRKKKEDEDEGPQETVYRDATGRRIDISMRRAEARREAEEKTKKEKQKLEDMLGDKQKEERVKRKEELEDAAFMPLARKIDDENLNRELKEKMRWDDPAMQFLSNKDKEKASRPGAASGDATYGKKTYQGPAAPNRYGIRPGHRWDGVDRSNGWEAERFKQANRRKRNRELDFAWQEDT